MSAILFGSISTIADTSELQREAFNQAFAAHGLDWTWDRDAYVAMLATSGGRDRIADYAASKGQSVDADAVHQTKSRMFQESLAASTIEPRPGVVETIRAAKDAGLHVALVTTTSRANIDALTQATRDSLPWQDFDLVVDASRVEAPKPDAAAYTFAMSDLGEQATTCVAIEDNVGGVHAAVAAGLSCLAFPNENTATNDFTEASRTVGRVDFDEVRQLIGAS